MTVKRLLETYWYLFLWLVILFVLWWLVWLPASSDCHSKGGILTRDMQCVKPVR